jgi:drug/metabolite transporter (DMT)-like permease
MNRAHLERRGLLALLAGAVCIGFAPIWVRWSEVGPVATAAYRVTLSLPFLWIWTCRERTPSRGAREEDTSIRWWSLAAGAFFALDLGIWHLSIRLTSVANATLLGNLAPIFVSLGAWIFFRERIERGFYAGLVLAVGGAWLLTKASLQIDPVRLQGDLLGAATALFYGVYQLCVARLRRQWTAGWVLLSNSLASLPWMWGGAMILGEPLWPPSARGWLVLLGLALTAHVLGQGLITYGFAHLPARHSSVTLLLQPLVAAVAGWILLGEPLSISQAVGGVILLGGIYVARLQRDSAGAQFERR